MNVKTAFTYKKSNNSRGKSSKIKIKIKDPKNITINKDPISIDSPLVKSILTKQQRINYPIRDIVQTNFKEISRQPRKLVLCIYRINTERNYFATANSFLQYLLFKFPESDTSNSNLCVFPFKNSTSNKNVKSQCNDFFKELTGASIEPEGFLEINNDLYMFYDISKDVNYTTNSITFIEKQNELWWCLIDEICNHKKILYFPIHKSVYELFFKNPALIYLRDIGNKKLETPIVAYDGGFHRQLPSLVLSINTLQRSFYNRSFGNYNFGVRKGGWSEHFEKIKINDREISDNNGKYIQGGVVRFAIFPLKMNTLIHLHDNLKKYKKNSTEWKTNYSSMFIGKVENSSKGYFSQLPHIYLKNFSQKTPLSVHLLDMSTLTEWNPDNENYKIK